MRRARRSQARKPSPPKTARSRPCHLPATQCCLRQTLLAAAGPGVIQSQDTSTQGVVGELIQCSRSGGRSQRQNSLPQHHRCGNGFLRSGPEHEL